MRSVSSGRATKRPSTKHRVAVCSYPTVFPRPADDPSRILSQKGDGCRIEEESVVLVVLNTTEQGNGCSPELILSGADLDYLD